jgi:hypothetical protein
MMRKRILYRKDEDRYQYWRVMIPKSMEIQIINYTLGHQGTDKCISHIIQSFYIRNLGRKIRRFITCCDTCQKVKHPNRAYEIDTFSHLPKGPNELLTTDLFGPLPTGRGGVKYLLVCLDVFSKHVTLYALRSATTRGCIKKLKNDYFERFSQPQIILSDHGSQHQLTMKEDTRRPKH